jgi:threonine aldolase
VNAKFLAGGLAKIPGIKIDPRTVQTNILIFDIAATGIDSDDFSARLGKLNILCGGVTPETVRFVTHMDVDRAGCERALAAVREICGAKSSAVVH